MTTATKLDAAIKAVCPINGVGIGSKDDKSTWRIDFKDDATAEQRAAARAVLTEFDATGPDVPEFVTMRQARLALLSVGKLAAVESAIQQAGDAAKIEWEYAQELRRDHPLVSAMGSALGLPAAELDQLFVQAATL